MNVRSSIRPSTDHARVRPALSMALAPFLLLLSAGCSGQASADAGEKPERPELSGREIDREVRDLITAVTPLAADVPQGEHNVWVERRKKTLERLRLAGPEVGRAMLEAYHANAKSSTQVREGLLDVAAHNLPEETQDILVELVTTYGDDLALRKKACRLLGATSPEVAVDVLGPLLSNTERKVTLPAADQMLFGWIEAMDTLGRDKSEVLSNVVVDFHQPQEVRHHAAVELGKQANPRGRKALETVVVESTGNHYLRRKALQALRDTVPKEEFCPYLNELARNEVDNQFQVFLGSMIDTVCR